MKRSIVPRVSFLFIGLAVIMMTGCKSGSAGQTGDEAVFDQEAFNLQIQGVYEYLPPNQGFAANIDNNFIFVFGDSDTTMIGQSGTYTIKGDTVIYITRFASDPDLVGSVIKWSARFMDNDSVKSIIFDDNGSIINEFYNMRKAEVDENTISQLEKFEGSYDYVSPGEGSGILLEGYFLVVANSQTGFNGAAYTYEHQNDTVACKRLISTNPETTRDDFRFVAESMAGDTLNWATVNDMGEALSRGQSLYKRK